MISGQIEKGIFHLSSNDPRLAVVIQNAGPCTLKPRRNYYYALLRAIVEQQLSGLAAASIIKKFFNSYNGKPEAVQILNTPDAVLRSLGLSSQKVKYIKDLSLKLHTGNINLKSISSASDEEIITLLTQVNGIGIWTVHMFLIFTLNRLNILPLNDLGIKKGIMKVYNLKKMPDERRIILLSRKYNWSPYNSIASWYLWKSLEM
jgi:DNA-3-methyladenine glycosylase II